MGLPYNLLAGVHKTEASLLGPLPPRPRPLQIGLWRTAECVSLQMAELRTLMPELDATELAVAGHAVALSQWHVVRPTAQHPKDVVHSSWIDAAAHDPLFCAGVAGGLASALSWPLCARRRTASAGAAARSRCPSRQAPSGSARRTRGTASTRAPIQWCALCAAELLCIWRSLQALKPGMDCRVGA